MTYLWLDRIARGLASAASARWAKTRCFFSRPRLGHQWGSGPSSWWGGPGCACGKKQMVPLVPGE